MFTPIVPKGTTKPIAPYVHGVRSGVTVCVSGTLAIGKDGESLHMADVKAQTQYVIDHVVAGEACLPTGAP